MTSKPVVAITGANGYVGSILADALKDTADIVHSVRRPQRATDIQWSFGADASALARVLESRGVTHLVHAAWDMEASSEAELEKICVVGSADLLKAARQAGIKHLIFISTISAFDGARSAYGRTKLKVEAAFLRAGGVVLRLGLVYGDPPGGAFERIIQIASHARLIPMIGDGTKPQYLLDSVTLGQVARRAVKGDFGTGPLLMTIANPEPVAFRDIIKSLASATGRRTILLPIPWRLLYVTIRSIESFGLQLDVRSDSILSFVYQDPAPNLAPMLDRGISPPKFAYLMQGDWWRCK